MRMLMVLADGWSCCMHSELSCPAMFSTKHALHATSSAKCCIQAKTAPLQVLCAAQAGAEAISGAAGRAGSAAISVPVFGTDSCKLFQGESALLPLLHFQDHLPGSVYCSHLVQPYALRYPAPRTGKCMVYMAKSFVVLVNVVLVRACASCVLFAPGVMPHLQFCSFCSV